MPATSTRQALGRYAAAVRWDKPNKLETARDLAAARIEDYVKSVVESAPPLTAEQRDRIATLLRGGANA